MHLRLWFSIPGWVSDVASYLVNTHPDTTWDNIALALYSADDKEALERVKSHLRLSHGEWVVRGEVNSNWWEKREEHVCVLGT